eukprot:CAMPEP_0113938046 /NCGR_PEP_ID=MMETSP1339-20121228/4475_1 /TAXON_ID=94617 /ORGANISM="Fibrocapsa japonica" /LENGTH=424 /DNA_ID=CAMNT_0000940981 /DNA_START=36 /DNA_END=1310 /DNA_ORIENTATION=+ /assembly_acc=CAM_ASM_000762
MAPLFVQIFLILLPVVNSLAISSNCPAVSPATNLANQRWTFRSTPVRYQTTANEQDKRPALVLVHGLFVNADHWRAALTDPSLNEYRLYALDLVGCGWSGKPAPGWKQGSWSSEQVNVGGEGDAAGLCGELRRFGPNSDGVLQDVALGTAYGGSRTTPTLELRHPLRSPYNFYTWADQLCSFTEEVVLGNTPGTKVTLMANSIGTISSLQAVLDRPDLFNGLLTVAPNFRELHSAEVAVPGLSMPAIRGVQALLRQRGKGLFDALAKPNTVTQILMEPYAVKQAVDETLIDVLLSPLLEPGASDVVFDTLSYSAGPLPEQQLSDPSFPEDVPVWVGYGDKDPWTPIPRVQKLQDLAPVKKVVRFEGAGHCPHDEVPEQVNRMLCEFLEEIHGGARGRGGSRSGEEGTRTAQEVGVSEGSETSVP